MDITIDFATDTAGLALVDPGRAGAAEITTHWERASVVERGDAAYASLGSDGTHRLRITDGELTADERDYAVDRIVAGLRVDGEKVFAGAAEWIPRGDEHPPRGRGAYVRFSPGVHDVDLFRVVWWVTTRWSGTDPDRPADVVARVRPRAKAFRPSSTRLTGDPAPFLFDSATRVVGPAPGSIVTTKVRRGVAGLKLKEVVLDRLWRPELLDWTGVEWKDEVDVRVVAAEPGESSFTAELVARRPASS